MALAGWDDGDLLQVLQLSMNRFIGSPKVGILMNTLFVDAPRSIVQGQRFPIVPWWCTSVLWVPIAFHRSGVRKLYGNPGTGSERPIRGYWFRASIGQSGTTIVASSKSKIPRTRWGTAGLL